MQKFKVRYFYHENGNLVEGIKEINADPVNLPYDVKGFVYRDGKQWFIREVSTGLTIGYGKYFSKDEAINGVENELRKLGAYFVLCLIQKKKGTAFLQSPSIGK